MSLSPSKMAAVLFTLVFAGGITVSAAAQEPSQQTESVAEAARRARAQQDQKKSTAKTVHVIDNDNLPAPKWNDPISRVGQPAAPSSDSSSPVAAAPVVDAQAKDQARQNISIQLKESKANLAELRKELDIAKRAFDLDQNMYYSNPGFQSDKVGKAHLVSEQTAIAAQQQTVDAAEKKVKDLEEDLKKLGGVPE